MVKSILLFFEPAKFGMPRDRSFFSAAFAPLPNQSLSSVPDSLSIFRQPAIFLNTFLSGAKCSRLRHKNFLLDSLAESTQRGLLWMPLRNAVTANWWRGSEADSIFETSI